MIVTNQSNVLIDTGILLKKSSNEFRRVQASARGRGRPAAADVRGLRQEVRERHGTPGGGGDGGVKREGVEGSPGKVSDSDSPRIDK